MRRFTSIALAFAFVLSMFSVGGGGNVAAEESFDCGSLEGLQVLHSTLREQADGGCALFESTSEQCRLAYLQRRDASVGMHEWLGVGTVLHPPRVHCLPVRAEPILLLERFLRLFPFC